MDAPSKFLILMISIAIVLGWIVISFSPDFCKEKILKSNDDNLYYTTVK